MLRQVSSWSMVLCFQVSLDMNVSFKIGVEDTEAMEEIESRGRAEIGKWRLEVVMISTTAHLQQS